MTTGKSLVDLALSYLNAGFSILPIGRDKVPHRCCGAWNPLRTKRATEQQVRGWFATAGVFGVAVIGGNISGGLEVLDFDDVAAYNTWREMVNEDDLLPGDLPVVRTPRGGVHIYLKVVDPAGSDRLAMKVGGKGKGQVRIETKGEGGYVVCVGSLPECHPDGGSYVQEEGLALVSWKTVRVVPGDVYQVLMAFARSLNQNPTHRMKSLAAVSQGPRSRADGVRVGDDFEARAAWPDIITPHGWKQLTTYGSVVKWQRPGKDGSACSATTGFCTDGGLDRLHVFSSNAEPFEMDHTYGKFAAYAILNHGGTSAENFTDAARALGKEGYGEDGTAADPRAVEVKLQAVAAVLKDDGSQPEILKKIQEARARNQQRIDDIPSSNGTHDGDLAMLRAELGIPVARIVKLGRGETPRYKMVLADGVGTVLLFAGVEALVTSRLFEMELMRRVERQLTPAHLKPKKWRGVRELMLRLMEVEDAEHLDTDDTIEWIADYLRSAAIYGTGGDEVWSHGLADGAPFIDDGCVWIHGDELLRVLDMRGVKLSRSELADRLRSAGCKRQRRHGKVGGREGPTVSKWYWQLTLEDTRTVMSGTQPMGVINRLHECN